MIPTINVLTTPLVEIEHPDRTYGTVATGDASSKMDVYRDRVYGYFDGVKALEQTIYFILGTERYMCPIYSWDYGVELNDLFGQPMPYVMTELPRRIKEALMIDNRISDVVDFEFERDRKKLHVTFTVISNQGNIQTDLEVEV